MLSANVAIWQFRHITAYWVYIYFFLPILRVNFISGSYFRSKMSTVPLEIKTWRPPYLVNHTCFSKCLILILKNTQYSPDQCDWVGWPLSGKAKGRWFDSRSGHRPGWQVQSPDGVRMRGNWSVFLSHIDVPLLFLPPFSALYT